MDPLTEYIKEYTEGENKGKKSVLEILPGVAKNQNLNEIKSYMMNSIIMLEGMEIDVEFKKIKEIEQLKKPIKEIINDYYVNGYAIVIKANSKRQAKDKIKKLTTDNDLTNSLKTIELQGLTIKRTQEVATELMNEDRMNKKGGNKQ